MDDTEGVDTVVAPDASIYDELSSIIEDMEKSTGGSEEVVTEGDSTGWLKQLMSLETLLTEKLMSGNVLAVCMAVIIATVLVFFVYKILSRQSSRDKAKDAKKKLKQQKNQKDAKDSKKKV